MNHEWRFRPWLDTRNIQQDLDSLKVTRGLDHGVETVLYMTAEEYNAIINSLETDKRLRVESEAGLYFIHGKEQWRLELGNA